MKAIIIKNENFETIGLEVYEENYNVFNWGVSSYLKSNFQKEVNIAKDLVPKVFEMILLKEEIRIGERFNSTWFEVAMLNKLYKPGTGVDFKEQNAKLESLKNKLEKMIKSF